MSTGANIVKPMGTLLFTGTPALTASARPYHIAVDWKLPADLQNAPGFSIAHFNLYRKENAPPDWAPTAADLCQTLPDNQCAYVDTNVQPGATYCCAMTYLHDDCQGGLTESPFSNVSCAQICEDGCAQPEILITGNNWGEGSSGNGPIETYDFSDGSLVHSFVPQSAGYLSGRGLAIYQTAAATNIYYTEVNLGGYSDGVIHICRYGTEGSGPNPAIDSGVLKSPDSRTDPLTGRTNGIQDLAFHVDPANGVNELFILSGYGEAPPEIFEIDPNTGNTVANGSVPPNGVLVQSPASDDSDGFAVLTNSTDGRLYFLINEGDHSPLYDEYDANGNCISGTPPYLDLRTFNSSFTFATGVAAAPDGESLYFILNSGSSSAAVLQISWPGLNQMRVQQIIQPQNGIEDIDVLICR